MQVLRVFLAFLVLPVMHLYCGTLDSQPADSMSYYFELKDYARSAEWGKRALGSYENGDKIIDTSFITILYKTAESYKYQKKPEEMLRVLLKDSSVIVKKFSDTSDIYADYFFALSDTYFRLNKFDLTQKHALLGMDIINKYYGRKHPKYEVYVNFLSQIYYRLNDFARADSLYHTRIEVIKENNSIYCIKYTEALNSLSNFYLDLGKIAEAEQVLLEALKIHKDSLGLTSDSYISTINNLTATYIYQGRYKEAEPYALDLYMIDTSDVIFLNNLGTLYHNMGKIFEAEKYYLRALESTNQPDYPSKQNRTFLLKNLADIKQEQADYLDAEKYYLESMELAKAIRGEKHPFYAQVLSSLGLFYFYMGHYNEAEKLILESLSIMKENPGENSEIYAMALNDLSSVYTFTDRAEQGIELTKKVLEIYETIGYQKHFRYAQSLNNLGIKYSQFRDFNSAAKYLYKSDSLYSEIGYFGNINFFITKINLASNCYHLGKFEESERIYQEAEQMLNERLEGQFNFYPIMLCGLGKLYSDWGRKQSADSIYSLVLKLTFQRVKNILPYLSEEKKISYWGSLYRNINDFYQFGLGYCNEKPELTGVMYDIAITTKDIVHSSTKKAYRFARQLKDIFEEWQTERQFWLNLVQNTAKAKTMGIDIDSVGRVAARLEAEISSKTPKFKKAFDSAIVSWKDVQRVLKPQEAAVEIIHCTDYRRLDSIVDWFAFLIIKPDSKTPEIVILKNGKDLQDKYPRIYSSILEKQLGYKNLGDIELDDLGLIYNNYWKPIADKIIGIKTVFIALDGVYNQINLNTLRNPASGKYLIDEIDLRMLSNTKDLIDIRSPGNIAATRRIQKSKMNSFDAVLFADPIYNLIHESKSNDQQQEWRSGVHQAVLTSGYLSSLATSGIKSLPGTKTEVDKIAAFFRKNGIRYERFVEASALKSKIMNIKNPKILHLATHGVFLNDQKKSFSDLAYLDDDKYYTNPLLKSMLLFSGAANSIRGENVMEGDNGILTAYEVMNLDLDSTDLVVLSACETGLGQEMNGEGIYGLQKAFQTAGAKSLIMSLWKVDDRATQELMTDFYGHWVGGMTKREAFRTAQQHMKKKYPGFYYWGAFVMVGE